MAKKQNTSQQAGLTRGKTAIIAILALVLLGVIYLQYGRSGGEDVSVSAGRAPYRPPGRRPATPKAKPAVAEVDSALELQAALLEFDQSKWKSPQLTTVVTYDPFALPAAFPKPPRAGAESGLTAGMAPDAAAQLRAKQQAAALERLQMQLEDLKQRGVHVIVNKNDQYVAMIGDRTVHIGDEINGFTVVEIDPKGVRVERKDLE